MKLFDKVCDLVARLKFKIHYHSGRVIDNEGNQYWYFSNFKQHRDNDLPAYVGANGTKEWWTYAKRDRKNGEPAVITSLGDREWWVDDQRHRDFGPAVEKFDGTKEWWQHGKLHREDGPAIEHPDGKKEYFRNGERWSEGPAKAPEIRQQNIEKVVEQATVVEENVKVMAPIKFKKAPSP